MTTTPLRCGALLLLAAAAAPLAAQTPTTPAVPGPVIHDFGATFPVPDPGLATPTDARYRVVFDVASSSEAPGDVSPYLNSVARFLNMHVRAGVPRENIELAVVLHGSAAKDALEDDAFQARFGRENRNRELIRQLADAGVAFYMCGQSAASRGLHRAEIVDEVAMALSAMTAMWALQEKGYRQVN